MRPTTCFVAILVLGIIVGSIQAEVLASSGNPMRGANPQRNRHITKKLLCPQVAPGRTQVWNLVWTVSPTSDLSPYFAKGIELTQDDEGFIYVQGAAGYLKFNATDGSFDMDKLYTPSSDTSAVPTHVTGNLMYIASDAKSVVVNTTSMQEIAALDHEFRYTSSSYAPYGAHFMVTAAPYDYSTHVFRFLDTRTFAFDSTISNVTGDYALPVVIYKNATVEIPIVVSNQYGQPIDILSPHYTRTIEGQYWVVDSYVQDEQLLVLYFPIESGNTGAMSVSYFGAGDGTFLRNVSLGTWDGQLIYPVIFNVIGTKSLASIYVNDKYYLIDFLNKKLLLNNAFVDYDAQYSIPDNSVLFYSTEMREYNFYKELISLDWDTQTVNAVGSFPTDGNFDDILLSPPLVGDDCMIYAYWDDRYSYKGLYAFAPLPISNIEPILECIDATGLAYLSARNKEDTRIVIPFAPDRNNISPLNVAGAKDFRANQRGKHFPFSTYVQLDNSASFSWQLEDYVLTFSNSDQLRCPQDVNVVLSFNVTGTVPSGFGTWVRQTFVELTTNVTDARVTLVTAKRRSAMESTFQIQLRIAKDTSGKELPAEEAARKFAKRTNIIAFTELIGQNATYAAAGVVFTGIDGVPLDTEISGTIPPPTPPSTQQSPSTSQTPKNVPKYSPTSSGTTWCVSVATLAVTALSCVVL